MSRAIVRFTESHPCPLCRGHQNLPRGQQTRCGGFETDGWIICTRDDGGGKLPLNAETGGYHHKARGDCPCGQRHAPDLTFNQRVERVYVYNREDGSPLIESVRLHSPKDFRMRNPAARGQAGEWSAKGVKGVYATPYHLDLIKTEWRGRPIWIVEGEKDADRLIALGLAATTNIGGARKWGDAHSKRLVGRDCLVIADNDEPGRLHAHAVVCSLQKHVASVKLVALDNLPEHGDVSDWLDADKANTVERLLDLAEAAPDLIDADLEPPPPAKPEKKSGPALGPPSLLASQTALLMDVADRATLWRSEEGEGHASIPTSGGAVEHVNLESRKFAEWLVHGYWKEHRAVPPVETLNGVRSVLSARARFEGDTFKQWVRVAETEHPDGPVWWLDLADDERRAARITPDGWQIVQSPDVKFIRPDGMRPIPPPERGGEIDELWEFVNASPDSRLLLLAFLTSAMRPKGPYPILVLGGEQGSAKSTSTRVLKRLIDDRKPVVASLPETPLDLMVVAASNWLLCFDNISSLGKPMSNAFCQLALEGGMERRKLHTDSEVKIFEAMRPIILNGIDDFARAPDLVDRMVMLQCPTIDPSRRRLEEAVWGRFAARRGRILGALLDLIVGTLAVKPTVELDSMPRMAEFATWGEAMARYLGHQPGEFLASFNANRATATVGALEDSAVYEGLMAWGQSRGYADWWGTYNELLAFLREHLGGGFHRQARLPNSARGVSSHIARIRPALRQAGIEVVARGRTTHARLIDVSWNPTRSDNPADNTENQPSQPSFAPPPFGDQSTQGNGGRRFPF